jgi:DNA invertase Pin-like site-specific DNA recombinase
MKRRIIAYYRVSTQKQGKSGLGLECQKAAVESFARQNSASIVSEYVEVESGRKKDRPALAKAISHAKLAKATLAVAKLDRLARNVAFTSALMESRVDFIACDNPHANKLTVHILAAVAEAEAEAISARTVAALSAAKVRGVKLGSARPGHWRGREQARIAGSKAAAKASAEVRAKATVEGYSYLFPTIQEMRQRGDTFQAIAATLNAEGHTTRSGMPWTPTAALRVWRLATRMS